jgi:four helix bundle protein
MPIDLDELRVLQAAEKIADDVWNDVTQWTVFARDTLGKQFVRAVDSIGANIAESFGRYSYGEKLQFLYYARGSLFETRYWLNRALKRKLLTPEKSQSYMSALSALGPQLNAYAKSLKIQRSGATANIKSALHEPSAHYSFDDPDPQMTDDLFHGDDPTPRPISNL